MYSILHTKQPCSEKDVSVQNALRNLWDLFLAFIKLSPKSTGGGQTFSFFYTRLLLAPWTIKKVIFWSLGEWWFSPRFKVNGQEWNRIRVMFANYTCSLGKRFYPCYKVNGSDEWGVKLHSCYKVNGNDEWIRKFDSCLACLTHRGVLGWFSEPVNNKENEIVLWRLEIGLIDFSKGLARKRLFRNISPYLKNF